MPPSSRRPLVSRRRLLQGGAGLFTLAALGGGAWGVRQALAEDADGGYIDIRTPAERDIRERPVHNHTVLQSFAFDNVNSHIYVIQIMQGGLQLPGEPEPVPWSKRHADGDMCLTKLDLQANKLGYMYVKGFGHGVAIGVEPADDGSTYLWTETDNNPDSGYGRAITRFAFVDEQILEYGVGDLEVHRMRPGSTSNTPSVDMLNRRLLLRYIDRSGAEPVVRYGVYDLDAVKEGRYEPLHDIARVGVEEGEVFQGFTLYGDHVYQMTGTSYTDEDGDNPPSKHGNCHLSAIDVRTGELVDRAWTQAAYSLPFREPEGVAVQMTQPPRLYMGFASGDGGARQISLYYKPQQA
ncbi:MAG: teichoic acid biosynthesis protein C [Stackebrandtia sp.]